MRVAQATRWGQSGRTDETHQTEIPGGAIGGITMQGILRLHRLIRSANESVALSRTAHMTVRLYMPEERVGSS
jgi:hypothetical protein